MRATFFEHRHRIEGSISLSRDAEGLVWLACRWPFDLDSDEWIRIDMAFEEAEYRRCVTDLIENEQTVVRSRTGGTLAIRSIGNGLIFDIVEPTTSLPRRLIMDIPTHGFDLTPPEPS